MDVLLVISFCIGVVILAGVLGSGCPSCKKPIAMRFTDDYRMSKRLGVDVRQRKVRCKYCSHSFWRSYPDSAPSGGEGP